MLNLLCCIWNVQATTQQESSSSVQAAPSHPSHPSSGCDQHQHHSLCCTSLAFKHHAAWAPFHASQLVRLLACKTGLQHTLSRQCGCHQWQAYEGSVLASLDACPFTFTLQAPSAQMLKKQPKARVVLPMHQNFQFRCVLLQPLLCDDGSGDGRRGWVELD
jgi:hypothetical protein